jgi:hypothetical protein
MTEWTETSSAIDLELCLGCATHARTPSMITLYYIIFQCAEQSSSVHKSRGAPQYFYTLVLALLGASQSPRIHAPSGECNAELHAAPAHTDAVALHSKGRRVEIRVTRCPYLVLPVSHTSDVIAVDLTE